MKVTVESGTADVRNAFEVFGFAVEQHDKAAARRIEEEFIANLRGEWGRELALSLLIERVGEPLVDPEIAEEIRAQGEKLRPPEYLQLHSPPTEARCRCCNRRLKDVHSIAAGEGPLCREGRCRKKAG